MNKVQPLFPDANVETGGDRTWEEHFGGSALAKNPEARTGAGEHAFSAVHKYDLLVITKDAGVWERLSASFPGDSQFNLRRISGSVAELESKFSDIEPPALAVVDIGRGDIADINALERLKRSRLAKVAIVAVSACLDQTIARSLMRVKADDWLPADCPPAEFRRACEKALHAQSGSEQSHAKCTTFFPANGGCGNTTLAIQTAFLLAGPKSRLDSICLVDLNFQDGSLADYLDIAPAFQISALSRISGRLDRQMLDIMLTRHRSGLPVLAAPASPGGLPGVSEELIASVLGLLSESFDHLVIDLPKAWHPWTENVIWGSDRVFVVASFTIPAMRHAKLVADAIAAKAAPEASVSVIVNKLYEPMMGAGLTRKDAEAMLGARLGGFIPDLGSAVHDAINQGVALSETRAGQKIEKRLSQILQSDNHVTGK